MSESFTARDVANLVLGQLKPLLEDIAKRMPGEGELAAINKGIGTVLELAAANALKLERLETSLRNSADNHSTLVEEVRGYHTRTIDQYDKLGARVHSIEERVTRTEERVTRIEHGETTVAEREG